jgi:hypothetical protein
MIFGRKVHGIKVENIVTLELIDKATGKVVERKRARNSLGPAGSDALIKVINGEMTDANLIKNWKYLYLFRSDKTLIKVLEGSWSSAIDVNGARSSTLTAQDSSSDEYTVAYEGLCWFTGATQLWAMGVWQSQSITKTADKILKCTWEIRVPYTATP